MAALERRLHNSMEIISPVWNPGAQPAKYVTIEPMADQIIKDEPMTRSSGPAVKPYSLPNSPVVEELKKSGKMEEIRKKNIEIAQSKIPGLDPRATGELEVLAVKEGRPSVTTILSSSVMSLDNADQFLKENPSLLFAKKVFESQKNAVEELARSVTKEYLNANVGQGNLKKIEKIANEYGISFLTGTGKVEEKQTTPPFKFPVGGE